MRVWVPCQKGRDSRGTGKHDLAGMCIHEQIYHSTDLNCEQYKEATLFLYLHSSLRDRWYDFHSGFSILS
jgi:hypothetical protein